MAGMRVGKATGVVYLPGLGFMCSPGGGGRALRTQPPFATYVVKRSLHSHTKSYIYPVLHN